MNRSIQRKIFEIIFDMKRQYDYNIKNITNNISFYNINTYMKKSLLEEIMYIIGKNEKTSWLFDITNNDVNKKYVIIFAGQLSNTEELFVFTLRKFFLERSSKVGIERIIEEDENKICSICYEKYKDGRACVRCLQKFCIYCQIKLMFSGFKNRSYNMTCPYCMYDHVILQVKEPSIDIIEHFISRMQERIDDELQNGNLSEKNSNDLLSELNELCEYWEI